MLHTPSWDWYLAVSLMSVYWCFYLMLLHAGTYPPFLAIDHYFMMDVLCQFSKSVDKILFIYFTRNFTSYNCITFNRKWLWKARFLVLDPARKHGKGMWLALYEFFHSQPLEVCVTSLRGMLVNEVPCTSEVWHIWLKRTFV